MMISPDDDTSSQNSGDPPGPFDESIPRWVKVFGIIALVLLLIMVTIHVTGGGFHGHASQ